MWILRNFDEKILHELKDYNVWSKDQSFLVFLMITLLNFDIQYKIMYESYKLRIFIEVKVIQLEIKFRKLEVTCTCAIFLKIIM